MPVTEIGDPRLQALFGANDPRDAGVKPVVRLPRKGLPPAVVAAIVLVFAVILFVVLNQRRLAQSEPTVRTGSTTPGASSWQAPPVLYVPPEVTPATQAPEPQLLQHPAAPPITQRMPVPAEAPAQTVYIPQPAPQMAPPTVASQPRVSAGSALVIDTGTATTGTSAPGGPGAGRMAPSGGTVTRMRASAFANRAMTVPQGYLIPAVLETGFDSTQPGFARAVVSRDVRSFDGTNVLIPRGSKLIGEYRADVAQGQKRAVILWTRLIRPDGMTIAMDAPAVDPVGRGGVPASVDTHFWARFGDALLQTTVGIGSAIVQRKVAGPVVVVSNNATTAATQLVPANNYVPTLTVPAGKSISVFVAHDLDFSAAGTPR